jgi:hypothetical protein
MSINVSGGTVMIRCPKDNYPLVWLENQRRYKCAMCGKKYLKKEAEMASFRRWNKRMRELEK